MANPFPLAEQIIPSRYDLIKQTVEKLNKNKQPAPVNIVHALDAKHFNELPEEIRRGTIQ